MGGPWLSGAVQSTDDESLQYRVHAPAGHFSWLADADSSIGVAYTSDAPRELVAHAFQVDLSCFWGFRGCSSVRQVTPRLWQDRQAIVAATAARLSSQTPCPDRLLAGRVRSLPDLNVVLLEVVGSRYEDINEEGDYHQELVTDYRLKEVIRGRADGPWTGIRRRQVIPSLSANLTMANPVELYPPKSGDRMLYFSGAKFDSCRIVRATPSAESAVRTAVPAAKRREDDVFLWMRPTA